MFLVFLAFVVLLSGFVAYAADNIARRVGRKHLRLFGLRPKTTALIVAVAAGMGISFASVLTFGLLNRQALRNIAQADTMRLEIRELKAELEPLRATIRDTEAQLERVRVQAAQLERSRDAAVVARAQAVRQAEAAEQQAAVALRERDAAILQADAAAAATEALQARVDDLAARRDALARKASAAEEALKNTRAEADAAVAASRSEVAQAEEALKNTRAEADEAVAASRSEVAKVEGQLRQLEQLRTKLQARVQEAQDSEQAARVQAQEAVQQMTALNTRLEELNGRLQTLQSQARQLTQQSSVLAAERDRLRKERDKAQLDVRAEQARRDALVRDNENLRANLQSAQAERARLAGDVARATSELTATRSGELVYEKGDLVHTQVVASVYNLTEAISGAQAKAAVRGARGNPAAVVPAATLERLRNQVRGMNWSSLVVFRANTNAVQGYPVELTAEAFPNKTLYQRDQVIRSGSLKLGNQEQMREQLLNIVSEVLLDLQGRGVPPEYIANGGLTQLETQTFLGGLKGQGTVRIGVASRAPVRPGAEVTLYPIVLKSER